MNLRKLAGIGLYYAAYYAIGAVRYLIEHDPREDFTSEQLYEHAQAKVCTIRLNRNNRHANLEPVREELLHTTSILVKRREVDKVVAILNGLTYAN